MRDTIRILKVAGKDVECYVFSEKETFLPLGNDQKTWDRIAQLEANLPSGKKFGSYVTESCICCPLGIHSGAMILVNR